jgi:hypothetical protein
MRAKGTVLKMLKSYIIEEHGSEGWQRWLKSLPPASQGFFNQQILVSAWYPFEDAVQKPMAALGQLFYGGDAEGNWKEGRYAAEHDLHGVYRVFVRVANPQFLMRNTVSIWSSYYADSEAQLAEGRKDGAVLVLKGIEPACRHFDNHVAGWVERALEICGCRQINIAISNPEKGNTRYEVSWDY